MNTTDVVRDLPPLVPAAQAAAVFAVTTRTLRTWIRTGRLRAIRTCPRGAGRVLVPRDSIVEFLARLEAAPYEEIDA